jgi:uncharacterized membrane protein YgaE (UPF0421/DUF939 family)
MSIENILFRLAGAIIGIVLAIIFINTIGKNLDNEH